MTLMDALGPAAPVSAGHGPGRRLGVVAPVRGLGVRAHGCGHAAGSASLSPTRTLGCSVSY